MKSLLRIGMLGVMLVLIVGIARTGGERAHCGPSAALTDRSKTLPVARVFEERSDQCGKQSRFADKDGNYKFSGLDPNADYEFMLNWMGRSHPPKPCLRWIAGKK
jgi:hypothetical protein